MRKLRLGRPQLASFLTDDDQIDTLERLLVLSDNIGTRVTAADGGVITAAATLPAMEIGETVIAFYKASGGARNVSLPAAGTYNVQSVVTVDNTATTAPMTKLSQGLAGGSLIVALPAGSSLCATVMRLT